MPNFSTPPRETRRWLPGERARVVAHGRTDAGRAVLGAARSRKTRRKGRDALARRPWRGGGWTAPRMAGQREMAAAGSRKQEVEGSPRRRMGNLRSAGRRSSLRPSFDDRPLLLRRGARSFKSVSIPAAEFNQGARSAGVRAIPSRGGTPTPRGACRPRRSGDGGVFRRPTPEGLGRRTATSRDGFRPSPHDRRGELEKKEETGRASRILMDMTSTGVLRFRAIS